MKISLLYNFYSCLNLSILIFITDVRTVINGIYSIKIFVESICHSLVLLSHMSEVFLLSFQFHVGKRKKGGDLSLGRYSEELRSRSHFFKKIFTEF